VKFLSEEWATALKDALNADQDFRDGVKGQNVSLQQVIQTDDGDEKYWLSLADGIVDAGLGGLSDPDVIITQDYETAVELAKGELNPVQGYMGGRIHVKGMMKVMQLGGAFSKLPSILRGMDIEY
jgi:putative sterol carrier protein